MDFSMSAIKNRARDKLRIERWRWRVSHSKGLLRVAILEPSAISTKLVLNAPSLPDEGLGVSHAMCPSLAPPQLSPSSHVQWHPICTQREECEVILVHDTSGEASLLQEDRLSKNAGP